MKTIATTPGQRFVDSYPLSAGGTRAQLDAVRASGIDGVILYLGVATAARVADAVAAGLAVMCVTTANHYDGATAAAECKALGLPAGCTVWLDVEGQEAWQTPAADLAAKIDAWARAVEAAGYVPGLYAGAPQPLTSGELWALSVKRYWKGLGRCVDRSGALAEPHGSGWCLIQLQHDNGSGQWWPAPDAPGRVLVDVDAVQADYLGRTPTAAVAG